ncbi:MAG: hypothetical protein NTW96_20920 [Planctomycetia bacterium]|nr:hypothetical protein [Planctomycetia bacterium]
MVARFGRFHQEDSLRGTTTDIAAVLMYAVGALLVVAPMAIAIGGGVAILFAVQAREMHAFAKKLRDEDLKAVMRFVLITCIILPVLPNRVFGPLEVFNPFETWLMVVLIVGMSLGGYILTDMDAITLSTARLARDGDPLLLAEGWRVIVAAGLANLVFKAGIVGVMGNRRLFLQILWLFAIPIVGGTLLLLLWPL